MGLVMMQGRWWWGWVAARVRWDVLTLLWQLSWRTKTAVELGNCMDGESLEYAGNLERFVGIV
jgi:hypothetical protein